MVILQNQNPRGSVCNWAKPKGVIMHFSFKINHLVHRKLYQHALPLVENLWQITFKDGLCSSQYSTTPSSLASLRTFSLSSIEGVVPSFLCMLIWWNYDFMPSDFIDYVHKLSWCLSEMGILSSSLWFEWWKFWKFGWPQSLEMN